MPTLTKSPSFGEGLPFSASFMAVVPPRAITWVVAGSILKTCSTPFTVTVSVSAPIAVTGPRTHRFCAWAGTVNRTADRHATVSTNTRFIDSSLVATGVGY